MITSIPTIVGINKLLHGVNEQLKKPHVPEELVPVTAELDTIPRRQKLAQGETFRLPNVFTMAWKLIIDHGNNQTTTIHGDSEVENFNIQDNRVILNVEPKANLSAEEDTTFEDYKKRQDIYKEYDLNEEERLVLESLMNGQSPMEISYLFDLSNEAIRTRVQEAFTKLRLTEQETSKKGELFEFLSTLLIDPMETSEEPKQEQPFGTQSTFTKVWKLIIDHSNNLRTTISGDSKVENFNIQDNRVVLTVKPNSIISATDTTHNTYKTRQSIYKNCGLSIAEIIVLEGYVYDQNSKEISTQLGLTDPSIRARAKRAYAKLWLTGQEAGKKGAFFELLRQRDAL